MRCLYSNSLPLSGSRMEFAKYGGTHGFSNAQVGGPGHVGGLPSFRGMEKLLTFGGLSMITELTISLAHDRRSYQCWGVKDLMVPFSGICLSSSWVTHGILLRGLGWGDTGKCGWIFSLVASCHLCLCGFAVPPSEGDIGTLGVLLRRRSFRMARSFSIASMCGGCDGWGISLIA